VRRGAGLMTTNVDEILKRIDERGGVWPADARLSALYDELALSVSRPKKKRVPETLSLPGTASATGAETMLFADLFPYPSNQASLVMCLLDPLRAPVGFFESAPNGVPFSDVSLKFVSFCMNMLSRSPSFKSGRNLFQGSFSGILFSNAFDGRLRGITPAELAVGVAYDERRPGSAVGRRIVDEMMSRGRDGFGERLVEWLFLGGDFPAPFDANAFLRTVGHDIRRNGFPGVTPEGLRALAPVRVRSRYVFRPERTDIPFGVPLAIHAGLVPDAGVWVVEKDGEKRLREGFSTLERDVSRKILSSGEVWTAWNASESRDPMKICERMTELAGNASGANPSSPEWPSKAEIFVFPPVGAANEEKNAEVAEFFGRAGFVPFFGGESEKTLFDCDVLRAFLRGVSSRDAMSLSRAAFVYAVSEMFFFGKTADGFGVRVESSISPSEFLAENTSEETAALAASSLLDALVVESDRESGVVFFEPSWRTRSIDEILDSTLKMCERAEIVPESFLSFDSEDEFRALFASNGAEKRKIEVDDVFFRVLAMAKNDGGGPYL